MPEAAFPAALALGAVSGMRSMMAPTVISWAARKSGLALESSPFSGFKANGIGTTAAVLALGEMVAQKLPTGSREDGPALVASAVSGGAAGAAVFKAKGRSILFGAVIGAAAAVGATYAARYLRKKIVQRFDVPDHVIALVEDGIALTAGLIAISAAKPRA